jgi:hypothetical protein
MWRKEISKEEVHRNDGETLAESFVRTELGDKRRVVLDNMKERNVDDVKVGISG